MALITLTNVTKKYTGNHLILDRINLRVKKGEFVYVVGDSGAGKSSLLRMIATEEGPTHGSVSLYGYNLSKIAKSTLQSIRRRIGYIPQDLRLIPELSVFDNIAVSVATAGKVSLKSSLKERIHLILNKFGLEKKSGEKCANLSGGEAQRVAVARALVRDPEIIIADEPTGAQDGNYTWNMMDLFVRANETRNTTVILATHDREIVTRIRRRCVMLQSGGVATGDRQCIY